MATSVINKVKIRLYRAGTGDCFLLQFKSNNTVKCKMMIDCGCITGARTDFEPWLTDIKKETGGKIDILVVTHEHADHINGFKTVSDLFDKLSFKKIWFAWTENESDPLANDLRQNHSETSMALRAVSEKLKGLVKNKYFNSIYKDDIHSELMIEGQEHFVNAITELNALNINNVLGANGTIPSMTQLFKDFKVIKEGKTMIEYFNPGDIMRNVSELPGMRVFVLGPPRDPDKLNIESAKGENYDKREKPSTRDVAFAAAVTASADGSDVLPFDAVYEMTENSNLKKEYLDEKNKWRTIDADWLFSAGGVALRYEGSINNTSLVLAFQFMDSQRVLLFPGDAEVGNWKSWHDGLTWTIKINNANKKVNAEYILNNTVFYKVGHHCSQNGSASRLGIEMMTSDDLTAMGPLNFRKIYPGWLSTMPNDILCANLIDKTEGKFLFSGNHVEILRNIKTKRVTIKPAHETVLNQLNNKFKDEIYVECEVAG